MKKSTLPLASLFIPVLLLGCALPAFAQSNSTINTSDHQQIQALLKTIYDNIAIGGVDGSDAIDAITANDARDSLSSDIFYGFPFSGDVESASITNSTLDASKTTSTMATVDATLSLTFAKDANNDNAGKTFTSQRFFTFKKDTDGTWALYDTDFYKGLGSAYADKFSDAASSTDAAPATSDASPSNSHGAAGFFGGLALLFGLGGLFILIPLAFVLLFSAFWLWMLIEACTRKDYPNKALWIVLIVIFGPLAAAFYYFMQHRDYKKEMKTGVVPPVAPVAQPPVPPAS